MKQKRKRAPKVRVPDRIYRIQRKGDDYGSPAFDYPPWIVKAPNVVEAITKLQAKVNLEVLDRFTVEPIGTITLE